MKSQNLEILSWLKTGHSITPVLARDGFGCMRLAARIYDLKQMGHNIADRMVEVKTRHGYTHVKRYSLAGG